MGSVISRWRKTPTTVEILEQIDKDVSQLEKFRKSNQALRTRVIGNLILYSILTYIIACIALYFLFIPSTLAQRCLQILPMFCFPILIYLLKRLLHWWFVRKISKNELQLQALKDQRKEILETVMEKETYKKAKEILEKFDPETKKKLEEERQQRENPPVQTPGTELRRRNVPATSPQAALPQAQLAGMSGAPATSPQQLIGPTPMATPVLPVNGMMRGQRMPVTPQLPRLILNQNRSAMEKVVEYFVGDGPSNRFALICKNCYSHNGMALREEFEYIEYRCAYCRFFNPARKQRPRAPRLPTRVTSPMVKRNRDLGHKPTDHDSGNDGSATPSPVSKASDDDKDGAGVSVEHGYQPKKLQFVADATAVPSEQQIEVGAEQQIEVGAEQQTEVAEQEEEAEVESKDNLHVDELEVLEPEEIMDTNES